MRYPNIIRLTSAWVQGLDQCHTKSPYGGWVRARPRGFQYLWY